MNSLVFLESAAPQPLRACLTDWRQAHPQCGVFVLLPENEAGKLESIQAAFRELSVPLVGAIFPALVRKSTFVTQGMWLLRLDDMPAHGLIPDLPGDTEEAAAHVATTLESHLPNEPSTLFMVFDAMMPNVGSLLDGLYLRLADRVRYGGVCAGSESFQPMPCLFDRERLVQNGLLWLLLTGNRGVILEHGYRTMGQMLIATSTKSHRIDTINWRPAFDVYREMMLAQYGVELTRENFYRNVIRFPFGILFANHVIVRFAVKLEDDGSLYCVGEIPPNALLTLLQAPDRNSGETVNLLAHELAELNGPTAGREMLMFYCGGRRLHLGLAAQAEIQALAFRTDVAAMAGALSLGEIGASHAWSYPLFHNATVVCTIWDTR